MSLSYRGYTGSSRPSLGISSSSPSSFRSGDSGSHYGNSSSSGYGGSSRTSSLYGRDNISGLRHSNSSGSTASSFRRTNSYESSSSYLPRSSYTGSSSSSSSSSSSRATRHNSYSSSSVQSPSTSSHSSCGVSNRVASDVINSRAERQQRRRLSESSSVSKSDGDNGHKDGNSNNNNCSIGSRRSSFRKRSSVGDSKTIQEEKDENVSRNVRTSSKREQNDNRANEESSSVSVNRRANRFSEREKLEDDTKALTDITEGRRFSERIVSDISVVQETSQGLHTIPSVADASFGRSRNSKGDEESNRKEEDTFDGKLASFVNDCDSRISLKTNFQLSENSEDRTRLTNRNLAQDKSVSNDETTNADDDIFKNEDVDSISSKSRFGIFVTDRFNKLGVSTLNSSSVNQPVPHRISETGRRLSAPCYSPRAHQGGGGGGGNGIQGHEDWDTIHGHGRQQGDQVSKSRLSNGTVKTTGKTSNAAPVSGSGVNSAKYKTSQEIERLESLCEARTKELTQTKIQLKASHQAFDAMTVLINYCCNELNAFECPHLAANLAMVRKQLSDCLAEIAELSSQRETLTKDVEKITKEKEEAIQKGEEAVTSAQSEKEEHARLTKELDNTHNAALTAQRDELTTKHNEEVKKLKEHHTNQMEDLIQNQERNISDMRNENKMDMNGVRLAHLEEIQSLRNKHDSQMEELHKQHRNKLEDITLRFETIKVTLSEKVESLKGECEDHLRRARCSEEALQKDADVKVQMAIAPYLALPKEIDSLKMVLEMRNEEIQKLRTRNTDLESQLEEIPIAREKIISLQQKVENLEAVINIKTDHEKQLHERCQVLMRKCDRETRANKRLSMDYEQVVWRMSQSEYGGSSESLTKRQLSRSPPRSETTSPDPRRRTIGGNGTSGSLSSQNNGEVRLRDKKRRAESESDRNLRSRSATFVIDRNSDNFSSVADALGSGALSSPPSSPRNLTSSSANVTPQRFKKKTGRGEDGDNLSLREDDFERRMCMSAGAELISASLNNSSSSKNSTDYSKKTGRQLSSSSQLMIDDNNIGMMESDNCANDDNDDMLMIMSGGSYTRSLSGVSDSGMCDAGSALNSGNFDSMTGSEMLNSSVFSTDSDWIGGGNGGTTSSANASLTFCDSPPGRQNENSFDPSSRQQSQGDGGDDFVKNSNTVVDMSSIQSTTPGAADLDNHETPSSSSCSFSESSSSYFNQSSCCSSLNNDVTIMEKSFGGKPSSSSSSSSLSAAVTAASVDNYEFQITLPDTAEEEEVFEMSDKH